MAITDKLVRFYIPCFKGHTFTRKPVKAQTASIKFPVKLLTQDGQFNRSGFTLSTERARWSGFDATREVSLKALTQRAKWYVRRLWIPTSSCWFHFDQAAHQPVSPLKWIHMFLPGNQFSVMHYGWKGEFLHYSAIIRLTGRGRRHDCLQRKEKGRGVGGCWVSSLKVTVTDGASCWHRGTWLDVN